MGNRKWILYFISVIFLVCACNRSGNENILIESFENESYGEWQAQGDAFGHGPLIEEEYFTTPGMQGRGMASSDVSGIGDATGTLTSPVFTIERNSIHFLIESREILFLPGSEEHYGKLAIELLIDGQVVRSQVPDEFHAMFRRSWDVSDLKGKEARIRIVDRDDRQDAYINIDHIIQNDIPAEGLPIERDLTITKSLFNLPVREGAERYYLELYVDGEQVRGIDVSLATDEVDYWVVTDLSQWMGKIVEIRTMLLTDNNPSLLERITLADNILDSDDLYRETLRPQFHFSTKRGWINDPNGLVYFDGEFHLFYQHNPFGWDHSRNDYNKVWGHAVSTDLVHWNELPGAVHPDHLGPIYSGSSVVDHNNTTGFQTDDEKPIVSIYTSAGGRSPWSKGKKFTQSISYSNDRGRTFTVYEGNPVQENLDRINRDPKVIWHEPTGQWVIVLHFHDRAMVFFTSDDLKSWEYQSELEIEDLIDCPELFQLPVDGDEQNKKWILYGGPGTYIIGEFDGKEFTPETGEIQYNYGDCFYASQTFSDVPESDGRRIQMAWGIIPAPEMPFNQMMLFPVELTLKTTDEGLRMFPYPVKEIENLWSEEKTWNDIIIEPGQDILSGIEGELFDISGEFEIRDLDEFGLVINGIKINYDVGNFMLTGSEESAKLDPVDDIIRLRILVDRTSIEVFANDGRIYMPLRAYPGPGEKGLEIFTKSGTLKINSLKVSHLESIWDL